MERDLGLSSPVRIHDQLGRFFCCSNPYLAFLRNCGQIFCSKCSSKTCPLPRYGIEREVRVCDVCFDKVTKAPRSSGKDKDGKSFLFLLTSLSLLLFLTSFCFVISVILYLPSFPLPRHCPPVCHSCLPNDLPNNQ